METTTLQIYQVTSSCFHLLNRLSDSDFGSDVDGGMSLGDQIGSCGNPAGQRCPWGKLHRLGEVGTCDGRSKWLSIMEDCVESSEPASLLHNSGL